MEFCVWCYLLSYIEGPVTRDTCSRREASKSEGWAGLGVGRQVVVLEKIVQRGFHGHLEDLLVRLSFNHYYTAQARTIP